MAGLPARHRVAALADPYRQDKDLGAKSNYQVFSNGPYRVEGKRQTSRRWSDPRPQQALRPVHRLDRDPQGPPRRDPVRRGRFPETIADRLIADHGGAEHAITSEAVPPPAYSQVTGGVADRSTVVRTPYVTYLVPHFRTAGGTMSNPAVREALKVSINVNGYIAGLGR